MESIIQPQIGSRLRVQNNSGTVRYLGQVTGAKGAWIGVEWDDPARGKHDGSKDGVRYFVCK
jgi:tubulin-specific chaperone E